MSDEYQWLIAAQAKVKRDHPNGDDLTAVDVNRKAIDLMGGVLPDDMNAAIRLRKQRGIDLADG